MSATDPTPPAPTGQAPGFSRWSLVTVAAAVVAVVLAVPLAAMGLDALREDRPRAAEG